MAHQFEFCKIQFPTRHICVLTFAQGVDVNEDMAIEILGVIEEYCHKPIHSVFNRINSYSYQLGALNLLCNKKMFASVNVVSQTHLAGHAASYETIVSDRKLDLYVSLDAAYTHINRLLSEDSSMAS